MKTSSLHRIKITLLFLLSIASSYGQPPKKIIGKIIKTSAFSTKREFDKIVKDQPEYRVPYQSILMMDLSWNKKTLDTYGNIVKQEDINFNDNRETILRTVTNKYYDATAGKLAQVISQSKTPSWFQEERFNRNKEGRLDSTFKFRNGALLEKVVYTYNTTQQRTKIEVYHQNGIYERNSFFYNNPSLVTGKVIKEVHEVWDDDSDKEETLFSWNPEGKLAEKHKKYYKNEKLLSDRKTKYSNYMGEVATLIYREGYDAPTRFTDGTSTESPYYQETENYKLDINGNVITFELKVVEVDKASGKRKETGILDRILDTYITCEYVYNIRQDWTKLVMTINNNCKYSIERKIDYLLQ